LGLDSFSRAWLPVSPIKTRTRAQLFPVGIKKLVWE
jgi:hypothetical protein